MTITGEPLTVVHADDLAAVRRRGLSRGTLTILGLIAGVGVVLALILSLLPGGGSQPVKPVPAPAVTQGPVTAPVTESRGATRLDAGVPVGYPHTQAGAVAAATNYLVAFGDPAMLDPAQRAKMLDAFTIGDGTFRTDLDQAYAQAAANLGVDSSGKTVEGVLVSREIPIGWRIESGGAAGYRIQIWASALWGVAGGASARPVTATYATNTIDLIWTGDWKWAAYVQSPGPNPVGSIDTPSSGTDLQAAVRGFHSYGYGS